VNLPVCQKEGIKTCFISIGEGDQLRTFLEKNPLLPPEMLLVDDYSFESYKKVGLTTLLEAKAGPERMSKMKAPQLSGSQWLSYLGSAGKLAPIPKDLKFGQIPEGVTRLGGTYGLKGRNVVYVYEDATPADYPDPEVVIEALR
jgi:hypothetical protein